MPQLRHIAISSQDPEKAAEFKYAGPDGVIVGISEGGWVGTPALGSDVIAAV